MRTEKSLFKNYLYNLSFQLLTIMLPVITVPYISRVLKPEGIGLYSYTFAIVSYVVLMGGLGLTLHGSRTIAISRNEEKSLKEYFWEIFIFKCFSMSLALVIYISWIFVTDPMNKELYLYQGIGIIAALLDITFYFNGLEEFKKIITRNLVVKLLSLVLMFLLVKDSDDILIYIIIIQGSSLIGNLFLLTYLKKLNVFKGINLTYLRSLNYSKHIIPAIKLFIPLAAVQIYTVLNKLMLGYFSGPTEVGYFDNAMKIITLVLTIITSLGTIMLPRASFYFSTGNLSKIKYQINLSLKMTSIISIGLIFGLIGINGNFVLWFFGPDFKEVQEILPILAIAILPISIASITMTQYLVPSGKNKVYTVSVVLGAITNILLNLALIPKYDAVGAAISYLFAEAIVTSIQFIYSRAFVTIKENAKNLLMTVISGIIMLIVINIILKYHNFRHDILLTFTQVAIGVPVYILVLKLLNNEMIDFLIKKIFHKRSRDTV